MFEQEDFPFNLKSSNIMLSFKRDKNNQLLPMKQATNLFCSLKNLTKKSLAIRTLQKYTV